MAVESDSVITNLDKFPPTSRKRKSEPLAQQISPHKRARSSQMQRSAQDVGISTEKALSEPAASKPEDEEPMMVTRRSKRQRTRASMSPSQPEQIVPLIASKTTLQSDPVAQVSETINGIDKNSAAPTISPRRKSAKAMESMKTHNEHAENPTTPATDTASTVNAGLQRGANIPGKKVQLQRDDDPNINAPNKSRKRAATPSDDGFLSDGLDKEIRVDYFARVQLRRKVVEIPLMTKNLNKEAKFIEQYADFVEAHDADSISFGLYKGLVEDHDKKGRGKGKKK